MGRHWMVRTKSPACFFALTFLLSALFYLLNWPAYSGFFGGPELGAVYIALFAGTPLLAAIVLTLRARGMLGFKALLSKCIDYKRIRKTRWLLICLLLSPLMYLLAIAWFALRDIPLPDAPVPLSALPAVLLFFFVLAAGEEAGWMGFVAEPLQEKFGALGAAIALGIVWALWHVPFFHLMIPNPLALCAQVLLLIGARVVMFWIFNNTANCVFAVILFHAVDNTTSAVLPDIRSIVPMGPVTLCVLVNAFALIIVFVWGPQTLARPRFRWAGSR